MFKTVVICFGGLVGCISSHYTDVSYIGCFKDTVFIRLLKAELVVNLNFIQNPYMTQDWCVTHCREKCFSLLGLRNGIMCFCDSSISGNLNSYTRPDSDCGMSCPGNTTQKCGGYRRLSMYRINETSLLNCPTTQLTKDQTTDDMHHTRRVQESTNQTSENYHAQTTLMETTNITTALDLVGVTTDPVLASSLGTSFTHEQANMPALTSNETLCVCRCVDVTSVVFKQTLHQIVDNIKINKKMTSLYKNSKISMPDTRFSSATIGTVGVLCVCMPLIFIVATDVASCFQRKTKVTYRGQNTI